MRRREFITLLGVAATCSIAFPLAANAQSPSKVLRIGLLAGTTPAAFKETYDSFRKELASLGWIEGENIVFVERWAMGDDSVLAGLAEELAQRNVDVIVTSSTPTALAAKRATSNIPIVFQAVGDSVADGLVRTLANTTGNLTGWSNFLPGLNGKRLALLKEAVPSASRIGILWHATNPSSARGHQEYIVAASQLGVTLLSFTMNSSSDLDPALSAIRVAQIDALIATYDPLMNANRPRIVEFVTETRLPPIGAGREYTEAGGLMSYGVNQPKRSRLTARYVNQVLKGAKPADLPVQQLTEVELVINLGAAKALGLTFPPSIVVSADEVIE